MTRHRVLRGIALAVVLVLGALTVGKSGGKLLGHIDELGAGSVVGAGAAVLAGLFATMLSWRAVLTDLGSPLPLPAALRVFFPGQLGKYIPGSVWPVLAQMELGKEHGVPRARSGTAGLLTVALGLVAGLLTAAVTLPFTSTDALSQYWYAFLGVPLLGIGLVPAVANPVLDKLLRLARRGGLEERLTGRGMAMGLGWSVVAWVFFGLQVWFLARTLGASGALPLSTGAFALAWTLGFLVVFLPAGAGVREAALVVGLSPVLAKEEALLVALVSRALMSLGDVIWAGISVAAARRHRVAVPQ